MPCVVKVCIGLVQISVMVEISIRIKENVSMFTMVNSQVNLRGTENMMDDIIASKNVTKVKILVFQVLVFLITLVSLVYSATMSTIYNHNKYAPIEMRIKEFLYIENVARYFAITFLVLFFLLLSSVLYLMHQLRQGSKKITDLPSAFSGEAKNLLFILLLFSSTYLIRFISDWWVVPNAFYTITYYSESNCWVKSDGVPINTKCLNFGFYLYYLPITLLFDFLPLIVIMSFHHNTFKQNTKRES